MPLSAESKATNLEKSLTAWIETHLRTGAGLAVFYGTEPASDRPDRWVHVDYLLGMRRAFGRQVNRTQYGGRVHGIVNLNLCQKRAGIVNLYGMAALHDAASAAFQQGQVLPVRDYDTVGTPIVGYVDVYETTEHDTDDGYASGVMVTALSITISYHEAFTYA